MKTRSPAPIPLILLFVASMTACSGGKSSQPANARPSEQPVDKPTQAASGPATPAHPADGFAVHEWGVIEITKEQREGLYGDRYARIPERLQDMVAKKPVLYFHSKKEVTDITVRITSPLKFVEWWPNATSEVTDDTLLFDKLTIDPAAACPMPDRTDINSYCRDDPAADGICERYELTSFVADGTCIHIPREPKPEKTPAKAKREAFPPANADLKEVPFLFYRLRQIKPGNTVNADKGVDMLTVDQKAEKFILQTGGAQTKVDRGDAAEWLRESVLKTGLNRPEMAVFMRVWEKSLLQGDHEKRKLRLYWLNQAQSDALIKLDIKPKPTKVNRALLVVEEIK